MEREKSLELSTSTLATCRSTTELLPQQNKQQTASFRGLFRAASTLCFSAGSIGHTRSGTGGDSVHPFVFRRQASSKYKRLHRSCSRPSSHPNCQRSLDRVPALDDWQLPNSKTLVPRAFLFGGENWNRTSDARVFGPPLYRLSYLAYVNAQSLNPIFTSSAPVLATLLIAALAMPAHRYWWAWQDSNLLTRRN